MLGCNFQLTITNFFSLLFKKLRYEESERIIRFRGSRSTNNLRGILLRLQGELPLFTISLPENMIMIRHQPNECIPTVFN